VLVVDDNVDAAESLSLLLQADGHQTELAHDGLASRPTLVAVTGWGQQQDRLRAAQAGFDMHLTKPVDPAVIMALARNPDTPALQAYAL
jgi:CheY-like chemotaxis protein